MYRTSFFLNYIGNYIRNYIRKPIHKHVLKPILYIGSLGIVFFLSATLVFGQVENQDHSISQNPLQDAETAINNEEWIDAFTLLDAYITQHPMERNAYYLLFEICQQLEKPNLGLSYVRKAIQHNLINQTILLAAIDFHLVNEEHESALNYAEMGFHLYPTEHSFIMHVGKIHRAMHQYNQAISYLQMGQVLEPNEPDFSVEIAKTYLEMQELNRGFDILREINLQYPKHALSGFYLGYIAFNQYYYDDAITIWQQTITENSDWVILHSYIGKAFCYKHDYAQATEHFQTLLTMDSLHVTGLMDMAYLAEVRNRPAQALIYYQQILAKEPANNDTWISMGNVYLDMQQHDLARNAYQQVLNRVPSHKVARVNMGWLMHKERRYFEAYQYFKQMAEEYTHDGTILSNLGLEAAYLGYYDESRIALERAIELGEIRYSTLYLAVLAMQQSDISTALDYIKTALQMPGHTKISLDHDILEEEAFLPLLNMPYFQELLQETRVR